MAKRRQSRHPVFSTIEVYRDHEPFIPFEVQLSSGKSVAVGQAQDILLNRKSDIAVFVDRHGDLHMVNLRAVASINVLNGKPKNGSSKN